MTYNVSIATDVNLVLNAPPAQIPVVVAQVFGYTVNSSPAERMSEVAGQIASAKADVVGLQEIGTFYTQRPGDFLAGNPVQASHVDYDFLQLLLDALHARGADYHLAASTVNSDVELPALDPGMAPIPANFYDVRLADRDAIIVRDGVQFTNPHGANYAAAIPISVGGFSFPFKRGWASVDVNWSGGEAVRIFTTHLETQLATPVQVAQADELIGLIESSPLPVIAIGDFNSAANSSAPPESKTPSYGKFIDAGLADAWMLRHPALEGLTCCHDELNLTSDAQPFDQRLDLMLTYGVAVGSATTVHVIGDRSVDHTPSGLWASDHAGLLMNFLLH
jgi:endonuclease/exonuclease/phosphatase family metal-dependent hydrolase